jgi:hypothetical protein
MSPSFIEARNLLGVFSLGYALRDPGLALTYAIHELINNEHDGLRREAPSINRPGRQA